MENSKNNKKTDCEQSIWPEIEKGTHTKQLDGFFFNFLEKKIKTTHNFFFFQRRLSAKALFIEFKQFNLN